MDLTIKQNTTQLLIVDPRVYGDANVDWDTVLTNAVVTFSLFDVETGCFVIASGAGQIVPGGLTATDSLLTNSISCGDNATVARIAYQFRPRDTKHTGVYLGTFQVNVLGQELIYGVPALDNIQLIVVESGIIPLNQNTYTGLPQLPSSPSASTVNYQGTGLIAATWASLNVQKTNGTLIPGQSYVVTDYQTIHRIPGDTAINTGPIEPLIIKAVSTSQFSSTATSTLNPGDIIHYEFADEYVLCGNSFDVDTTVAGAACVNNNASHRPGYITYRENKADNRSAYYDYRAFLNSVSGTTGYTFATGTSGKIGKNSGNIILNTDTAYVEIGENSQAIYLTKIASRIKIGNDVRRFTTSGVTAPSIAYSGSSFELYDGGVRGVSRVAMQFSGGGFTGLHNLAVLPANCIISSIEFLSQAAAIPTGATLSMGIQGISPTEIFATLPLITVASGVFTAQVTTRKPVTNTYVTSTLSSSPASGTLRVNTAFINTSI